MRVKLKPDDLTSSNLSWLCVQPMLLAVRGKDLQAKLEMYNQLNEGQKGLYLYYSFHNHTKTMAEFYWFSAYNINELQSWKGIKNGVLFFQEDSSMAELFDDIEMLIVNRNSRMSKPISPSDLECDNELFADVKKRYDNYIQHSEIIISRMNNWIRAHKEDFIEVDE
ncbi:hypothetical protein [Gorillibacterium massiliense]|uniref:hypothetical protein n=1 Tax=Gorillibacterium massiliense TaxID=1280390 RepID=UPI000594E076|nr:hypothetical protein [Gorillibacterium massiliense]